MTERTEQLIIRAIGLCIIIGLVLVVTIVAYKAVVLP